MTGEAFRNYYSKDLKTNAFYTLNNGIAIKDLANQKALKIMQPDRIRNAVINRRITRANISK